ELHPAPDGFRDGAETWNEICEDCRQDGLFSIALGELRRIVDLDHHGIGPRGHGGERHLRNKFAQTDSMSGVYYDRQVRLRFKQRDGIEIERVTGGVFESP